MLDLIKSNSYSIAIILAYSIVVGYTEGIVKAKKRKNILSD